MKELKTLLEHLKTMQNHSEEIMDQSVDHEDDTLYNKCSHMYWMLKDAVYDVDRLINAPMDRIRRELDDCDHADITNFNLRYQLAFEDAQYLYKVLSSVYDLLDKYYVDGRYITLEELWIKEFGDRK